MTVEASPEEGMWSWALTMCWRRSLAEEHTGKQSVERSMACVRAGRKVVWKNKVRDETSELRSIQIIRPTDPCIKNFHL